MEPRKDLNEIAPAKSVFDASDANRIVTFSNMDRIEPTVSVKAGGKVRPLLACPATVAARRADESVKAYLKFSKTVGVLLLQNGKIVCEHYNGIDATTKWASFFFAESFIGTLVGIAVQDGKLTLNDKIKTHLPDLTGSAYADVTVENLLHMRSGVKWEDYSDIGCNLMPLLEAAKRKSRGAVLEYLAGLREGRSKRGGRYPYNHHAGDSHVLGALLERVTGRPLHEYLSEKIWKPAGMEADGYWQSETEGEGMALGGWGLSATLHDYGRFGQFILDGVEGAAGHGILPPQWEVMAYSDSSDAAYGYHWHTLYASSDMPICFAEGLYGQRLYIDRNQKLVMVLLSHWSEPQPAEDEPLQMERLLYSVIHLLTPPER